VRREATGEQVDNWAVREAGDALNEPQKFVPVNRIFASGAGEKGLKLPTFLFIRSQNRQGRDEPIELKQDRACGFRVHLVANQEGQYQSNCAGTPQIADY